MCRKKVWKTKVEQADGRTDGQTEGQGDSYIAHQTSFGGGGV